MQEQQNEEEEDEVQRRRSFSCPHPTTTLLIDPSTDQFLRYCPYCYARLPARHDDI